MSEMEDLVSIRAESRGVLGLPPLQATGNIGLFRAISVHLWGGIPPSPPVAEGGSG